MIKKILVIATLLALISIPLLAATASAATIDGKGAVATWNVPRDSNSAKFVTVYAVLSESNSGTEGNLYLKMHGQTVATFPVDFKWNMNHITVSATVTFWGETHTIVITWNALPKSQGQLPEATNGMTLTVDGSWKEATATLTFENEHPGTDPDQSYQSNMAYIVHGNADVSIP
jgi:hypothetical protein